jgi:hypothetical protein
MNEYFVRTIELQPVVTLEESELIDALTLKEYEDRFPIDSDDPEEGKVEAYKIGSHEKCKEFISAIDTKIQHLFTIESLPN